MRYLNKVIFINSANIPYAEVKLDGNVHFIGTQGVGKSTLLRAILFFYNGDKLKLGIPKEKKSFDDFYLSHSNSYIVYEVTHEYGPFCVLVFRSQGRACFRFIDAGYDRGWLVDSGTGDVTSEYSVIRQRLDGHFMSRIIDKYEEYRNIIYGNHHATDKEFYRFAIMESPKYQNIPRSIQNVFLNSRVDADFIKEIIIRSMNDDEANIDLGYYRRQVAEFEQEYNDISIWFKVSAKGEVTVRKQAEQVISLYRRLLYQKERIIGMYSEMLYALRDARERIPILDEQRQKQEEDNQRIERLISEERQKYDRENAEINKMAGAVEEKLKTIKVKRRHYQEIDILSIVKRVDGESDCRRRLDSLQRTKETLTLRFKDLSEKYRTLEDNLRAEFQSSRAASMERISYVRDEAFRSIEDLAAKRDGKRAEAHSKYSEALALIGERMAEQLLTERDLDKELVRLNYYQPLSADIVAEREVLQKLCVEEKTLGAECGNLELQSKAMLSEYENLRAAGERERDDALKELERDEAEVRRKYEEVSRLLSESEGSLYQWLDTNRPGWVNTVGKVIDQNRILYRKGLNPVLTNGAGDTLFGVSLDLSDVEADVRTPLSLKEELAMYESAMDDMDRHRAELVNECEKEIESLTRKMSPKMKELREKKSICEAQMQTLPGRIKSSEVKISGLEDRQKEMISVRREELNARKMKIAGQRAAIEDEREKLDASRDKQIKAIDKAFAEGRKIKERERDAKISSITAEVDASRERLDMELSRLMVRRDAEMAGAGVDVGALNECETSISAEKEELKYIDENREKCIEYRIDSRDLFDREEEFKDAGRELDLKRSQLEAKFEVRGGRLKEQLEDGKRKLEAIVVNRAECEDGVRKCEDFQNGDAFPGYLSAIPERKTMVPASEMVSQVKDAIFERSDILDRFKQAVNLFKGNFGPGNTFKFKTSLSVDEEYLEYAAGLEEFIEQNKIEDYRGRTSDRYLEILGRVSREMGEIARNSSEVEKTIRDINYDFKEKNFVGAIRSIEMRKTDSGDRMAQLLQKIKEFNDENQFYLGGVNLFSDTEERSEIVMQAVRFLQDFMGSLNEFYARQYFTLSDAFQLQFRVVENDNDTGWVEKIANVGSDGTDILVKAMVNIMLINVFKEKVSRKFGEFRIHCMMDEIGKLHPSNVKGILDFANNRNILLINSSPTTYNVSDYKYTYLLSKDSSMKTTVIPLITRREAELGR